MTRILLTISFIAFLLQSTLLAIDTEKVHVENKPIWTMALDPNLDAKPQISSVAGGYYYILLDKQHNVQTKEVFVHVAFKITGFEGIKNMSDISVDFDPAFQQLGFHKLVVHREGKIIDKLKDHVINTFQREVDMDRNLYDGRLTAVINLKDIRLNDIIEFEYTISGINPVYEGYYDNEIAFEFVVPVNRIYVRLIVPNNAGLKIAYPFGEVSPEIITMTDLSEYIWDRENPNPILYDNNVPYWFDFQKKAVFSNFTSWNDVVKLLIGHYKISSPILKELKAEVNSTISNKNETQLITNAIRFVQDEIRYLGFESGINAYKPHPPLQVLNQRYGDCKDKSLLLCAILKVYGVNAYPVLVNTNKAYNIEESLPSFSSFDHVIVQIDHKGTIKYIDPTISQQGGVWDNIFIPDYRVGLVIKNNASGLVYLPSPEQVSTVIQETFDIYEVGGDASFIVETNYYGADADIQRSIFANNSIDYLSKYYADYYSNIYPGISLTKSLEIVDDRDIENSFTVKESYYIGNIWETDEQSQDLLYCNIYASQLEYVLGMPQSANREMPYYIAHPTDITLMTRLKLPEYWPIESSREVIETKDFKYESSIEPGQQSITLTKRYKTYSDYVPSNRYRDYQEKVNRINENITYQLTYYGSSTEGSNISWFAVILSALALAGGATVSIRLYKKYSPAPKNNVENYTRGIGGWLVLIGIGLVLSPIVIIFEIIVTGTYFDATVWQALADPNSGYFNLSLLTLVIVELIYNSFALAYIVLLTVLYFKRRTSLPRLIIIFFIVNTIFVTLDTIVAFQFVEYIEAEKTKFIGDIIRTVLVAAIWVPYFLYSERVKDTFVIQLNKHDCPINADGI